MAAPGALNNLYIEAAASSRSHRAPFVQGAIARLAPVELALCLSYLELKQFAITERVAQRFLRANFINCKPSVSSHLSYENFRSVDQFIGTLKIAQATKTTVSHLTLTEAFFN